MRKDLGLTGGRRFSQIYQEGRGWANNTLVLRALPNKLDRTRFGVVAGRRVGKAVVRNKVKRRLREVIRQTGVKSGWDLVFIARKCPAVPDYKQLQSAAQDLLRRARLLHSTPDQREEQN